MADTSRSDNPVEIEKDVYWVGASMGEFLRRNVYLRVFRGNGKMFNVLVDPGPPVDFDGVLAKINRIIGGPENLHAVTINHQDPDVGANASQFIRINPRIVALMTEDTWRLAQYYGIDRKNFTPVERFRGMKVAIPTGHVLQFVPTPFCHFRGACMVYDRESRVLFSGDLFGGIAAAGLPATDANWTGIKAFHQLYMPSNDALRLAVKSIRALDPAPVTIAPQHGGILKGELVQRYLGLLEELPVGLDILSGLQDKLPVIIDALNATLDAVRKSIGAEAVKRAMHVFHPDGSYPAIFALGDDDSVTDVKAEPLTAMNSLMRVIFRLCPADKLDALRNSIWKIFLERDLPPLESAMSGTEEVLEAEIVEEAD